MAFEKMWLGTTALNSFYIQATPLTKIYIGGDLVWRSVYPFNYTVDATDSILYDDLIADGWDGAQKVEVTVDSGVTLDASTTSTYGLDCDTMGDTVELTVINLGAIKGKGGKGGTSSSGAGNAGGDAMRLGCPTTLFTASGFVFAGGGGGGAGANQSATTQRDNGKASCVNQTSNWPGKGGGGGAGEGTGAGGSAGGSAGTATAGGAGGTQSSYTQGDGGCNQVSKTPYSGGDGGAPGAAGSSAPISGGAGGVAGAAIDPNGFSLTISSGDNATQIKGATT